MFLSNKYSKWYYSIIHNAKSRSIKSYVESHHIIPKSLGGSNDPVNKVSLTPREHVICHWLLTKMTIGKEKGKMIFALRMMKCQSSKHKRYESKITARAYESTKIEYSIEMSKIHINRTPWNKGKTQSTEHNKKISESNKGRKQSPDHRRKNSESKKGRVGTFTGKTHTDETKLRLSELNKGPQIITTCPHCQKSGGQGNMTRYHFNKCRFKLLLPIF